MAVVIRKSALVVVRLPVITSAHVLTHHHQNRQQV
jgi:hypothetical protein